MDMELVTVKVLNFFHSLGILDASGNFTHLALNIAVGLMVIGGIVLIVSTVRGRKEAH